MVTESDMKDLRRFSNEIPRKLWMKDNESQCIIKLGDSYNKRIQIQKQNSLKNKKKTFSQFLKQVPYFYDKGPTLN